MARRKRTSGFEDLINIMARLPWWACLGIALLSWLILSSIASRPMDVSGATLDQVGGIVMGQLLRTFAYGGQYRLPCARVLDAIRSVVSRFRRNKLPADVQADAR